MFDLRVEKCGYDVPVFDFRLEGVTSMSADVHKYGLSPKVLLSYYHLIIIIIIHIYIYINYVL